MVSASYVVSSPVSDVAAWILMFMLGCMLGATFYKIFKET